MKQPDNFKKAKPQLKVPFKHDTSFDGMVKEYGYDKAIKKMIRDEHKDNSFTILFK